MKTLKKALPVATALVWALLLLPFFLGVSGIWYSIIAAEFMAVCLSLFFLIRKAKKYGYA